MINWSKVVDPTTKITFLGVEIDSVSMEVRLPREKLSLLQEELAAFKDPKRASKQQLQSLVGKLNWASAVIRGGRVFLRRIINCMARLKRDWHKIFLKGEVLADINWWQNFIGTFNGKSLLLDKRPITSVFTDACCMGAGGHHGQDWFYASWDKDYPFAKNLHINELEAFAVVLAAIRWAERWRNKKVVILSDNMATVHCLNKCTSKNKHLMAHLRNLFWLSASHNFHLVAIHVAGKSNWLADSLSRLHERDHFVFLMRYCLPKSLFVRQLEPHMSNKTLFSILSRHVKFQ
jgi:hypothetical protein